MNWVGFFAFLAFALVPAGVIRAIVVCDRNIEVRIGRHAKALSNFPHQFMLIAAIICGAIAVLLTTP